MWGTQDKSTSPMSESLCRVGRSRGVSAGVCRGLWLIPRNGNHGLGWPKDRLLVSFGREDNF